MEAASDLLKETFLDSMPFYLNCPVLINLIIIVLTHVIRYRNCKRIFDIIAVQNSINGRS